MDHSAIVKSVLGSFDEVDARTVVAPLGLVHPDYVAVGDACVDIASHSELEWHFSVDLPYGLNRPRKIDRRLAAAVRVVDLDAP